MLRDNENGTSKNENPVINDKVTIYKYHYMREWGNETLNDCSLKQTFRGLVYKH